MTRRLEAVPVGYPGFEVMRPPRPSLTGATLKRVALAKLADITRMSATFGGERVLFEPWLTLLVDHGRGAFLAGVYRTGAAADDHQESADPGFPNWCLRKSEWNREADLERSRATSDLSDYLSSGPQVASRLLFTNRATHPDVDTMMQNALAVLRSGITLAPVAPRRSAWQLVDLDVADDSLICRVEYSPLIARSESLEAVLPPWLDSLDELLLGDGISPDGKVTISVKRSVPELVKGTRAVDLDTLGE